MSTLVASLKHAGRRQRAVIAVVLGVVMLLVAGRSVLRPVRVVGGSMEPALSDGDRVLVAPIAYRFRAPRRFDVVVLEAPFGDVLVKRIAALGGETVAVVGGRTLVDGRPIDWPGASPGAGDESPPEPVAPNSVWVIGDSRDVSLDSRTFGTVPVEKLEGPVVLRIWPVSRAGRVH